MTNQLEALIAEMKAAAEKASKGDWIRQFDDEIYLSDGVVNIQLAVFLNDSDYLAKLDAIHVAASQPKNVLALIAALEQVQQYENVHYADAAEVEIASLRKRIAELEASPIAVKLPVLASIHSNWSGEYLLKSEVIEAIRAAGGTVEGE